MDRRMVVSALVLCLVLLPLAADAQQAGKVWRIGFLSPASGFEPRFEGFTQGLRDLGDVEGQNIAIEYRWAEGKLERLPLLAAELARLRVDVMVVGGLEGLAAAKQAGGGLPIVSVTCDVPEHFVVSLSHPGGSATGVTCISSELATKRLQLLKEAMPRLVRIALLYNPGDPSKTIEGQQTQAAAKALGLAVHSVPVRAPSEFEAAFTGMKRDRIQAVIVLADSFTNFHRKRIVDLATRERLPAIYGFREYVDAGGLMSYGTNLRDEFRRAATYVDKILKGAKPADLPVEQPTKFELVINLKTAKALGLAIPQSVLMRADQVIE